MSLYDGYLASRNVYRAEFLDLLVATIGAAPVMEASNGYGAFAVDVAARCTAPITCLAESAGAAALCRDRFRETGFEQRIMVVQTPGGLPTAATGLFGVVYSISALHTWADPALAIPALARAVEPGGVLLVNDLRRDGDPSSAEFIVRELGADGSLAGQYRVRTFRESLSSAYTIDELRAIMAGLGTHGWAVEEDGPLSVTIRLEGHIAGLGGRSTRPL
jgi:SAM-dependent methyltransferase